MNQLRAAHVLRRDNDLYLPSIPASLQTLGRCECAAACALAPHGLRITSPLVFYLNLLRDIWTFDKKLGRYYASLTCGSASQLLFPWTPT